MTDAESAAKAIQEIESLPEPSRSIAQLLVQAGQIAILGHVLGVEIRVIMDDGRIMQAGAGLSTFPQAPTHAGTEARH
jgi:hypothetical protein